MKKIVNILLFATAITLCLNSTSYAGLNSYNPVRVYSWGAAYGGVHDARFNSGSTEHIGCGIYWYDYDHVGWLACSARDSSNNSITCFNHHPDSNMRTMVSSINESSDIAFYVDSNGLCTGLNVYNESNNL
jgi:hypothetical protein